jgi:transposase
MPQQLVLKPPRGGFRPLTKSSPLAGTFDLVMHASQALAATDRAGDGQSRWSGAEGSSASQDRGGGRFSFMHDRVAELYSPDNGRPPLDPTLMFKALFVGYLFGIRFERQLVREIEVNVAYRWFLGLKLTDPVFDASTLSQNRRRRYNDTAVAQDIFDAIVAQAIAKGLVEGTVLYTDSTHLKANANKLKLPKPSFNFLSKTNPVENRRGLSAV